MVIYHGIFIALVPEVYTRVEHLIGDKEKRFITFDTFIQVKLGRDFWNRMERN